MNKEMQFFIYLLEHYAEHKNTSADKVLAEWNDKKISDFIFSMYERYHTETIENAYDDIERLENTNKNKK